MNRQLFEYSYELKKQNKRKIISLILYCISIYLILNLIFAFLLFPVKQTSDSMTPDFPENSISFVTKIFPVAKMFVLLHPLLRDKRLLLAAEMPRWWNW